MTKPPSHTRQYADYSLAVPSPAGAAATSQAQAGPAPPVADDPKDEVNVTPQPALGDLSVGAPGQGHTEERVEYRDENGRLLNEAQVKELEGKVEFTTRYETRTRLLDTAGNEVDEIVAEGNDDGGEESSTVPAKADGEDPETSGVKVGKASDRPAKVAVGEDVVKERKVGGAVSEKGARPESPVGKASGRDEL